MRKSESELCSLVCETCLDTTRQLGFTGLVQWRYAFALATALATARLGGGVTRCSQKTVLLHLLWLYFETQASLVASGHAVDGCCL